MGRSRRLTLYVAQSNADPDAHARSCACETEEHGVVISTVDVVVLYREPCSWAMRTSGAPQHVPDARTRILPTENNRRESRARLPEAQESGSHSSIGRDLDAGACVTKDGGRLDQRDAVSGVCEADGQIAWPAGPCGVEMQVLTGECGELL